MKKTLLLAAGLLLSAGSLWADVPSDFPVTLQTTDDPSFKVEKVVFDISGAPDFYMVYSTMVPYNQITLTDPANNTTNVALATDDVDAGLVSATVDLTTPGTYTATANFASLNYFNEAYGRLTVPAAWQNFSFTINVTANGATIGAASGSGSGDDPTPPEQTKEYMDPPANYYFDSTMGHTPTALPPVSCKQINGSFDLLLDKAYTSTTISSAALSGKKGYVLKGDEVYGEYSLTVYGDRDINLSINKAIEEPGEYYLVYPFTGCTATLSDGSQIDLKEMKFGPYTIEEAAEPVDAEVSFSIAEGAEFSTTKLPTEFKLTITNAASIKYVIGGFKCTVTGPDGADVALGGQNGTGNTSGSNGIVWYFAEDWDPAPGEYTITIPTADLSGTTSDEAPLKFPTEPYVYKFTIVKPVVAPTANIIPEGLVVDPEVGTVTNLDAVKLNFKNYTADMGGLPSFIFKAKALVYMPDGTTKTVDPTYGSGMTPVDITYNINATELGNYAVEIDLSGSQYFSTSNSSVAFPEDKQKIVLLYTLKEKPYEGVPPALSSVTPAPGTYTEWTDNTIVFTVPGFVIANYDKGKVTITDPEGTTKEFTTRKAADLATVVVDLNDFIAANGKYTVVADLTGCTMKTSSFDNIVVPVFTYDYVLDIPEVVLPEFPAAITMTADSEDVEITVEDDESSVTISAIGTTENESVTLTYGALPEDWTGIYTVSGGMMMNNLRTATGDDDEYLWVSLDEFNEQYEGATITEGLTVTVPADGQRHQYMSYLFAGDKVYIGKGIMLAANIAAAPTTYIPSGITVTPDPTQDVYELPSVKVDFTGLGVTTVNGLGYKATAEVTGPDGFSKTVELGASDYTGKAVIYRTGITGLGEYVVTIDLEGQEYFANGWKDFPAEKIVLVYNIVEKPLPTFPEAITMTANSEDVEITVEDDESSVTISAIGTTENESVTLTYGALPEDWTGIYTVSGGMMMMNNLRTATGDDDDEYLWVSLDEFNEEYAGATITEGLSVTVPADGQRHQYMSFLFAGDKVYVGKGIMLAANISQVVLPEFPSAINVTTESEGVDIETTSDESGFSVDVTGKTKDEEVTLTVDVPEGWDGMYIINMASALMNLRTATGDEEDWISMDEFKADPMGESAVEGNTIVIPTNNDYFHYYFVLYSGDQVYIGKGIDITGHIEKDTQVGISLIEAVDPDARYFDMSGVEIKNPANGLYIKVAADGKVSKVIVK